MKAYLVLTGLIGLLETTDVDGRSQLLVLLLRTDHNVLANVIVGEDGLGHDVGEGEGGVVEHAPRMEFWPDAGESSSLGDLKFSGKQRWQIRNEDIFVNSSEQLVFSESEKAKFADVGRIEVNGVKAGSTERVRSSCLDAEIGDDCRLSVVGRVFIGGGKVSAIELEANPLDSLRRSEPDQIIWGFRSSARPEIVSSNLFRFASAVFVELGDNVELKLKRWPHRIDDTVRVGEEMAFTLGEVETGGECEGLVPESKSAKCTIIHIMNIVDAIEQEPVPLSGAADRHFLLFSGIVGSEPEDTFLPYRVMFPISPLEEGSGSGGSQRCVPKLLCCSL